MSASEIVNKDPALPAGRWNYAHVLRDDGVGNLPASPCSEQACGDYVEQITCLIILKMADEREKGGVPSTQRPHPDPLPGGEGVGKSPRPQGEGMGEGEREVAGDHSPTMNSSHATKPISISSD